MKKQKRTKKNNKDNKKTLSVVILNYNTKELLSDCLDSLKNVEDELDLEVIVIDNASSDGSVKEVKKNYPWSRLLISDSNLGFAAGNNLARNEALGKYILFLNSDTIIKKNTLKKTVEYMEKNKDIGALTCKLVLANGQLDKDVRRSFPTPWVAFTHLVFPLDRLFKNSPLFAKYWYTYLPDNKTHDVDVLQGAFFLTRKKILDQVGWFDEEYFLDGEDIDLSWRIKADGWRIVYYPKVETIHIKGASKGKQKHKNFVPKSEKLRYRLAGVNSMEIFYKKHLWERYPFFINYGVLIGLKILKGVRIIKITFLG